MLNETNTQTDCYKNTTSMAEITSTISYIAQLKIIVRHKFTHFITYKATQQ